MRSLSDSGDVPIRVSVSATGAPVRGRVSVSLRPEVEPLRDAPRERHLTMGVEAVRLEGGDPVQDAADLTLPPTGEALAVVRELRLRPGLWQARVVVRDEETGAIGSVRHTLEVAALVPSR
jgi:hypothetical protein